MTQYDRSLSLFDEMLLPSLWKHWAGNNALVEKALAGPGYGLSEDENTFYLEIAMPGVKPEDISLTYDKGILNIQAENKSRKEGRKYHQQAQYEYTMKFTLPAGVDEAQEPVATYESGVLHLQFNKKRKYEPKKIMVRSE